MSSLSVTRVNAFSDNYIWLIHGNTSATENRIIIVDPGDAEPVLDMIASHNYIPHAIFITHHHGDHTGGIRRLLKSWDIPVYGPANEKIVSLTHPCKEGDEIVFDELHLRFQVMDVPGHTAGHIAYSGHQILLIGDTLFAGGCGRLFEGTALQMQQSLDKLRNLADDTLVYCAHEYTQDNLAFAVHVEPNNPDLLQRIENTRLLRQRNQPTVPSRLDLEKATNPFLRYTIPAVIKAAEDYMGESLKTPADVFRVVREWKDDRDAA